jgi:toxin-antitoxin system PIN domain toxin
VSVYLPDINLLVALLWTNHEHHEAAATWFRSLQRNRWATCPFTEAGFVRVSSNPRVFRDAPPPMKAVELLETNLPHRNHVFWEDDVPFAQAIGLLGTGLTGHQQVTDAYLFGLAIRKGGTLVTFDAGIAALVEPQSPHLNSLEILSGLA